MTDPIEAMAKAFVGPWLPVPENSKFTLDELREVRWQKLTPQERSAHCIAAASALAALRQTLVPVGYLYTRDDGDKDLLLSCNGEYATRLLELGATECPLYALPEIDNG